MEKNRTISFDQLARQIDKGIAGTDTLRADQLARFQVMLRAKDANLQREQARLTARLGADHPRVVEVANKAEINRGVLTDVTAETVRARTPLPAADATTWVLHGYVRDSAGNAAADLTVALYDDRVRWVELLGFTCTGENGYFRLESHSFSNVQRPVFLRVLNQQRVHLYADPSPVTPAGGVVDYREIILPAGGQACTPPAAPSTEPPSQPEGTGGTGSSPDPDVWVVRGRVTDARGNGLAGLTVSVYDKDLLFDDRLGRAATDENGNYQISYRTRDFRDLIEKNPDIYVNVLALDGAVLYSSKGAIRYAAGRVETVNVEIKR